LLGLWLFWLLSAAGDVSLSSAQTWSLALHFADLNNLLHGTICGFSQEGFLFVKG